MKVEAIGRPSTLFSAEREGGMGMTSALHNFKKWRLDSSEPKSQVANEAHSSCKDVQRNILSQLNQNEQLQPHDNSLIEDMRGDYADRVGMYGMMSFRLASRKSDATNSM